jgi:DNA-binding CsgD family transcriptional regulator
VGGDGDRTKTISNVVDVAGRPTAQLRVLVGAEAAVHVLRDRICVIGRDPSVDLRLSVEGVSRHHAKVVTDFTGAVQVVDLGAKNGTFVNGVAIKVASLEPGDRIQLGRVVLRFERVEASEHRPSAPPGLSPRELEVARLVARGLTNAEVASVLGISRTTVATHLQRVFVRLGLSSRAELASYVTAHES